MHRTVLYSVALNMIAMDYKNKYGAINIDDPKAEISMLWS